MPGHQSGLAAVDKERKLVPPGCLCSSKVSLGTGSCYVPVIGRKPHEATTGSTRYSLLSTIPEQKKEVKMLSLWTKLTTWVKEDKGASMVEYALLVVLIAIIAIVAISIAGKQVSTAFSTIANTLSN